MSQYDSPQQQKLHHMMAAIFSGMQLDAFAKQYYPSVATQFSPDGDPDEKIHTLISHVGPQQLGKLVADVREAHPDAYNAYVQSLKQASNDNALAESPPSTRLKNEIIYEPEHYLSQSLGGRYRLDKLLDKTGLAAVFKAHDTKLGVDVAIKLIDLARVKHPTIGERVRQQTSRFMRLDHPGVVKVYDYGESNSLLYIIKEYIDGFNLEELEDVFRGIDRSHIIEQTMMLARQLCSIVSYMHGKGMLHPSSKPNNIMVKPGNAIATELAWQPVMISLGLLRPNRESLASEAEIPLDRLIYTASPELFLGHNTDIRSDVYALGVLFYYLFTGEPPFRPKDAQHALKLHVEQTPTPPRDLNPEIPDALQDVILKAMAKEPSDRYLSVKEMRGALDHVLEASRLPEPSHAAEVSISVGEEPLVVAPGGTLKTTISIHNEGKQEVYTEVRVAGIPGNWVSISPSATTLSAEETQSVEVEIQPPRDSTSRAGRHTLLFQVTTEQERDNVDEAQKILTVAPFYDFESHLEPTYLRAGQTGQVTVTNRGNLPMVFDLRPTSESDIKFSPKKKAIKLTPGEEKTVNFKVTPVWRLVSGYRVNNFSIAVIPRDGEAEQTHTGEASGQGAISPRFVLAALVMLALAGCTFAFFYGILLQDERDAQQAEATATAVQATQIAIDQSATAVANNQPANEFDPMGDNDNDGLTNAEELELGTDPDSVDTDGDTLRDNDELTFLGTSPVNADTDYDGLPDNVERQRGLDPTQPDSDDDGIPDAIDESLGAPPTATPVASPTLPPPAEPPVLAFNSSNYTVQEQQRTIRISVLLNRPTEQTVRVRVDMQAPPSMDNDFVRRDVTLIFTPGEDIQSFDVTILQDNVAEVNEIITLVLRNPSGATLAPDLSRATLTIIDDDQPVRLSIGSVTTSFFDGDIFPIPGGYALAEGDKTIDVAVELTQASTRPVQVSYRTEDGTASASEGDYRPARGTLRFAPGETRETFEVFLRDDNVIEGDETFTIALSDPNNLNRLQEQITIRIEDDD